MATTFVEYTGDGNATKSFSFPSYQESDVKVRVDGVLKTTSTHYNITGYTTTGGGNVVFTSGNIPSSPANIRIYRDTNVDTAKATFTAGSSVKAADLNNNTTQLLYRAQEEQIPNLIHSYDIDAAAIETSNIKDANVTTAKLADDAVTMAKIADGAINDDRIASQAVSTVKLRDGNVTTAKIADSNVTTAKIADSAVTTAKILDANVTRAKIADSAVDSTKISDLTIGSGKLSSNAVITAKIADSAVTTAKIADDAVTQAKIAANAVDTTELAVGAVTHDQLADNTVDADHLQSNAVTTAKILDGNVTRAKLEADIIDGTKIANDAVDSEHLAAGSIDNEHLSSACIQSGNILNATIAGHKIANNTITANNLASNSVTTDKIADSELSTLAGMQSTTASNLASSTALTATTAELNQLDGITLETTLTSSDTRIPTSKAVNDQILAVTNALGGFVAIADETSFPTSNPDPSNGAGTVVSISEVSSSSAISINSSGVATIANGAGTGNTVTITGFPTTLRNTSLAASSGLQVQTTTTLHTYTFHKQLASAADIAAISATVNSFSNRYRVSSSAPTSSLDGGDLWYDTTNSKLMVYSSQNSAWEESSAIGNFFISTISSSSSTGGGSATPNGTAYRFTISNAPSDAQQCLVSVDGVIQKPNSGSSQPSEGFVLVGNDIIFGAAPANGASLFVTVIGSTVGIGTPSNNTVTTAILQNGSVTTAKIVDANVTTAKIADNAVTTAKIPDDAITSFKIANSAISTSQIADNTVTTAKIVDGAVSTAKIADDAVTTQKINGQAVTEGRIANNAVTTGKIADDAVTSAKIASNSVTNDSIANDSIHGDKIQTQTISLAKLVHGTSSQDGKFLRANNGADPTFETVNTDLVADTTPQLGGDLETNGNHILVGDSSSSADDRIKIGAGGDLQLYHDGSNSFLAETGTGVLSITTYGSGVNIYDTQHSNFAAKFSRLGQELYYENNKKFETTSVGFTAGTLSTSSSGAYLTLSDSSSYGFNIEQSNSKNLTLRTDGPSININQKTNGEYYIRCLKDAAVELYYNGNKKFETTNIGVTVTGSITATDHIYLPDNKSLKLGAGHDFILTHDTTNNVINSGNGNLYFQTANASRAYISSSGLHPASNNTYDLGTSSQRWRNVYTNDLNLSNEGSSNDVDGSWGDWTIQEGESDLFLKNNRSGKKYKFNLTEVA